MTPTSTDPLALVNHPSTDALLRLALEEDLGQGDVTTAIMVPANIEGHAQILTREDVVVAGLPLLSRVRDLMGASFHVEEAVEDGQRVLAGGVLARLEGPAGEILSAERLLLNLLQRLTGIATMTRRCVELMGNEKARLLETRKTLPGWRRLDKYAVLMGGGTNHRLGLHDQILAKENHFALAGSTAEDFAQAVVSLLDARPEGMLVEVEVESLEQLTTILTLEPTVDIVLLDNMTIDELRRAVSLRDARGAKPLLEASGGIGPKTLRDVAATGVDRISMGALTHSVRAPDLTLLFD
ncbi:MAG TPA: carboxylating nicotinate-nucleotide diphosphorylase [Planctomycetes bacterium]|nr:carboxylating nicotinate-nucleotide diphosphorylase [Planctomycetota bacterium]